MYGMEKLRASCGYNDRRGKVEKVHIVAMPYPAQGHIVPLMQLCKQLASKEGYKVTFVNTEHNHARMVQAEAAQYEEIHVGYIEEEDVQYEKIKGDCRVNSGDSSRNSKENSGNNEEMKGDNGRNSGESSGNNEKTKGDSSKNSGKYRRNHDISSLEGRRRHKGVQSMIGNNNIRLVGIPGGLPPELHGDPAHVVSAFQASEALAEPFGKLLEILAEEGDPATCIISDVLMSWTQASADAAGNIPRFAFWTSSAAVLHVIWHMYHTLISQGIPTSFKAAAANATFENSNTEMVSCIPGLPPMNLNDLPIIVRSDPGDFIYQFLSRQLKPMDRAAAVLINTFFELEQHCLQALPSTTPVPIYPIGPLLPASILPAPSMNAADFVHSSLHGESPHGSGKSSFLKDLTAAAVGKHDAQAAREIAADAGNSAVTDRGSDVAGITATAAGEGRKAGMNISVEKETGSEIDGGKAEGKDSADDGKTDWRSRTGEDATKRGGAEDAGKGDAKVISAGGSQGGKAGAGGAVGKAGGGEGAGGARGKAGKREGGRRGGSAGIFNKDERCVEWLDKKEAGSVLYISFGSIFVMSEEQFTELVEGLLSSKQPFLWSIRPGFVQGSSSYTLKLPPHFLHRTQSHGLMVSWVPQLTVLSHPAIGGFLTHCGWNSTLESVALGVPMLCWPDVGERRTNGRLAVSLWEAGLEFSCSFNAHMNALLISRHEVERVILLLMDPSSPVASHLRSKAASLQESARLALSPTGSSSHAWNLFLHHIEYPG